MTQYRITKSTLNGEISVPSSKSHTLRAILFGAMGRGRTVVHNYLPSTDTHSMIEACRILGASIDVTPEKINIQGMNGKIKHAHDVINAGNSGIVLRFCSAIGALAQHPVVITGDHSIRYNRPMFPLIEGLSQLGVSATSMRGDGFAPIIIRGPIKTGTATLNGEDSQPVSALLIASAFVEGPAEINVRNPGEKPWINLTLDWFKRLGIPYMNHNFERYQLKGHAQYDGFEYTVPSDLSTAAFPIAAALMTGSELLLRNIDMHDVQGDKELIAVFQKMGAQIDIDDTHKTLHVKKGSKLSGITVDINDFVDAITILAVVACVAEGETLIQNASIARHKECNRIRCITEELKKMGADITETNDGLIIRKSSLKGANLHSHNDHRMAMSLTVAALAATGESAITSTECVSKTFPAFLQEFNKIGARIKEES